MAINDPYFTHDEYMKAANVALATADDEAIIDRQALSISRFLDKQAGQFFAKDAAVVQRVLQESPDRYLSLDQEGAPGIASKAGLIVNVDGVVLTVDVDFRCLPLNADKGPEAKPWYEIELTKDSKAGSFATTDGLVYVTAIWGWPAVPSLVKDTAIELCSIWRAEGPRSTGRMNELETVVAESPLAQQLVNRFIKAYRKRIAVG